MALNWSTARKWLLDALSKASGRAVRLVGVVSGLAFWPLGIIAALMTGTPKVILAILAAACFTLNWTAGRVEKAAADKKTLLAQEETRQAAEEARREAARARVKEADFKVTIQEILVPFVHELESAIGKSDSKKADSIGAAKQILLAGLSRVLEGEARGCLRACLFRLDSPDELISDKFAGRTTAPRHRFTKGTEEGDYVFKRLEQEDRYLITEATAGAPPWLLQDRNYCAFISVPVATRSKILGMLTVDSTEPNVLQQSDVSYVRVMAGLLTVALSL
ncbi:GAF domain-containing protein [Streptomyces sp. NBC_01262]|uniref:GAF domain-containing protein n=1 Tax=Streptomyces sp. NBC_01262 TaxID=2903803 RepID=UPI002E2EB236|nr:GAF domain-containing protein [Streptomyces sp. NBC_01262]